jgi:hypothetical protein
VYNRLVHAAEAALAAAEGEYALHGVQLTGYLEPNLGVFVQDMELVQQ